MIEALGTTPDVSVWDATTCLAGYGLVVAVVAPWWLDRVAGGGCAPRIGVAAWLAAALTALGSLLGAGAALAHADRPAVALVGWCLLGGVAARAVWVSVSLRKATVVRRTAHAQMCALVGHRDRALGVVVVPADEPLVYCLRSPAPTVVVTTGARAALTARQLRAVLAHERAHLAGRHHLWVTVASVLGGLLPGPLLGRTGPAVAGLLEMRADDVAAARHGHRTVAEAIAAMAHRPIPAGALGAADGHALTRGLRLCRPGPVWRQHTERILLAATAAVLATGPYLASALPWCPHPWW